MGAGDNQTSGGLAGRLSSSYALTGAGWLLGTAFTLLVLTTPSPELAYRNPALLLFLETIDGSVALLFSFLVFGRFRRTSRLQDLLVAQGFMLLAVAGLGMALTDGLVDDFRARLVGVWVPASMRLLAAALIVTAALVGRRRRPLTEGPLLDTLRWAPRATAAVGLGVLWLERGGPLASSRSWPPLGPSPVVGHDILLGVQAVGALCLAVASVAFTVQVAGRDDELLRWLGGGCALAAFGDLNYEVFPPYGDWFYPGDVLRTGGYVLLIVGAAREIQQYWAAQARIAVLEDRRRLARELHDGVVQELGYIRAETQGIGMAQGVRERVTASCDRALDEARVAIYTLGSSADESLAGLLRRAATQVAERYGGRLDADLDESVSASADQRHALVRITREAVSNALRHGNAGRVTIRLHREQDRRHLVVADDGTGFDVAAAARRGSGYGLTSMRERAGSLPGEFTIESCPGRGTVVGVAW